MCFVVHFSRVFQLYCILRRIVIICRSSPVSRPSFWMSVTRVYCDKTAEARITRFTLKSSKMPKSLAWYEGLKGLVGLKPPKCWQGAHGTGVGARAAIQKANLVLTVIAKLTERAKNAAYFGHSNAKNLSASGGLSHDPITRDSTHGPPCVPLGFSTRKIISPYTLLARYVCTLIRICSSVTVPPVPL